MPRSTRKERVRARAAGSKGAAAEGDRARPADGATQGRELGRGQGTGRARRGAGRAPRCRERSKGQWASGQARAWVTGGGTHGTGGCRKGPQGKGKGARGPQGQAGRGMVKRYGVPHPYPLPSLWRSSHQEFSWSDSQPYGIPISVGFL